VAAEQTEPVIAAPEPAPTPEAPAAPVDVVEPPPRPKLWTSVGLRTHVAMILTLGTAVLLAYSNTFISDLTFDSRPLILEDPRVREVSKENFRTILRTDYWYPHLVSGLYRPVTTLSYQFNYAVLGHGQSPVGYHLLNLGLHWVNATLVYFLVLAVSSNIWPAFLTAIVFAMHPVATEAVTNIAGRPEELAALTVLGGLLLYLRSHVERGARKLPWLVALTVMTMVGAFARENALVLAGLMLVYDLVVRLPEWREKAERSVFWDLAAGYLAWLPAWLVWVYAHGVVAARLPTPEISQLENPLLTTDVWTAKLTAIKVIGKYLWLLIWPTTLSCDYSYNQIPLATWRFTDWEAVKSLMVMGAVVWLGLVAVRFWRRNRPITFCILFFFVALLPVSNLFTPLRHIMAERHLYLPLVGFAGLIVFTVYSLCRVLVVRLQGLQWAPALWLQFIARTVLLVLALAFGIRAWMRNTDWESNLKLWSSAVVAAPDSFKTHRSLAYVMYELDRKGGDEKKSIDEVIQEAEKARDITNDDPLLLVHLGHYYVLKGNAVLQRSPDGAVMLLQPLKHWYGKALEVLTRAAELDHQANARHHAEQTRLGKKPEEITDIGNFEIYWNLGVISARLNNHKEALAAYEYMRHLAPTNPDAYLGLASVYLGRRQFDQAAIPLLQTLILDGTRQEAMQSLVEVYRQVDREGCSIEFTHGEPRLNPKCRIVRDNTCQAYADLIQTLVNAKQPEAAQQARQQAIQTLNCSTEELATPFRP